MYHTDEANVLTMVKLFKVTGSDLVAVGRTALPNEAQLEDWIAKDPLRIGLNVLVIGRQVTTPYGGRIDLLGIDQNGNLAVIELKRDMTPRDIVAQVLDYASWVRELENQRLWSGRRRAI